MSSSSAHPLKGKTALVTGGSRGIGRAIAERLQREGARVAVVSRSASDLDEADFVRLRGDVSREESVVEVLRRVDDEFGQLDILVNNAAIELEATAEETTVEQWDHVMAVNVRSAFLCFKESLPLFRRAGAASVINISSIDGYWAEPGLTAYNTSKGALLAFTRSVAIDHGHEGIRCNAICPSYVLTPMLKQFFDSHSDANRAQEQAASAHALKRLSQPEDIAALAFWLAGDESSFATGQSYVLDGGLTCGRTFDLTH